MTHGRSWDPGEEARGMEQTFPSNLACDHARINDYVTMCHACANTLEREREEDRQAIRALVEHITRLHKGMAADSREPWIDHAATIARATKARP
jgi:hypothetical protein